MQRFCPRSRLRVVSDQGSGEPDESTDDAQQLADDDQSQVATAEQRRTATLEALEKQQALCERQIKKLEETDPRRKDWMGKLKAIEEQMLAV